MTVPHGFHRLPDGWRHHRSRHAKGAWRRGRASSRAVDHGRILSNGSLGIVTSVIWKLA